MNSVIINLCVTGMIPTKKLNVNTPITPREIARSVFNCSKLGISIAHIHARDKEGKPTWKREIIEEIIYRIKEKNEKILISVSTSGRNWQEFEKRTECLDVKKDLKPDLASLTLGSFNFINQESINSPDMIEKIAKKIKLRKIKPEIEVFEAGMVHKANFLIKKGLISKNNPYFNTFFGSLGTAPLHVSSVSGMHSLLPENAIWSMSGIGRYQLAANTLGLSLGSHVRVGLEDAIFMDANKNTLASNEKLVERILKIMNILGKRPATFLETKKILNI